jgi:sortase A
MKMNFLKSKKLLWAIIILAVLAFSTSTYMALFYFPSGEVETPHLLENSEYSRATSSLPERLIVPSLGIDADIQHLGVTEKGNMAAPKNYTDVGWYKYGTIPGMKGSAVMAGHLDNGFTLPAVFKRLNELKQGDDVYVVTADGTRLRFVVESTELYKLEEGPLERIFKQNDTARLNLITCEGWWTKDYSTFDHRRVVYTKLVKE